MVLRPASSPRKTKLAEAKPVRQDPKTHLAEAPTPPGDLLREPALKVDDRQGMADLAALKTYEEVASLPVALRFRADTERSAHGKPMRPETQTGLAERSPDGTEERRAPV